MLKRIWFICWVFGAFLSALSFMLALIPNNLYFVYVGVGFLFVHVIGLIKYSQYRVEG